LKTPVRLVARTVAPLLGGDLRDRCRVALHARVRDHDVDAAELGHPLVEHRGDGVEVARIGAPGEDPPVELLDQPDGLVEILRGGGGRALGRHRAGGVEGDDVRALLGEPHGVHAALAACRSGDERDLALQSTGHAVVLLSAGAGSARSSSSPRRTPSARRA
jgi:hypothetical protein